MKKSIVIYSIAVAIAAFLLQWLDYLYSVHRFSTEIYIAVVALAFTSLGVWAGMRITGRGFAAIFEKNDRALNSLGITDREYQVLELLAAGRSNQEIADGLFVSANTVKTHIAHLYDKLDVSRRTQAIHKARALHLIP